MLKPGHILSSDEHQRAGNVSIREMILTHLDGLYRFALRLAVDPQLAQELTQESALRALQHEATIVSNLRAWLFQTLYHAYISHYRQGLSHREQSGEDFTGTESDLRNIAGTLSDRIAVEDVRAALETLPEDLRTVVWLSDAEDFRLREIAEILEWPMGTVASRIARARKELRRLLSVYSPSRERQI